MTTQPDAAAAPSRNIAVSWQDAFAELCRSMMKSAQVSSAGPHGQGAIEWDNSRECPKCQAVGVLSGIGLCFKLSQDMDAYFCPTCEAVTGMKRTFSFATDAPESFLLVMRQRMSLPLYLSETHQFGQCPTCLKAAYTVRLSPPDSFDNKSHMFFACKTPGCAYGAHISE